MYSKPTPDCRPATVIAPVFKSLRLSLMAVVIAVAMVAPDDARAAGLGSIEVYSTLYQPLDAEIEILNIKPGDIERLTVKLAGEEDFRRTGVEQLSVLNSFRFDVISKNGRYFVHLTSGSTVIREPFLHFLVNADWVYGKLVREYTVILDLPLFGEDSQQARHSDLVVPEEDHSLRDAFGEGVPVALDEPQSTSAPEEAEASHSESLAMQELAEIPEETPFDPVESVEEDAFYEEPAPEPPPSASLPATTGGGDQYGPVQTGENLWNIVATMKSDSITMNQAMLAVLRANSRAFINENINLLKTGTTLRIPGYEEMLELSRDDALDEARRQNALWEEYRSSVAGVSYRLEDSIESDSSDLSSFSNNPLLAGAGASSADDAPEKFDDDLTSSETAAPSAISDEAQTRLSIVPGAQDQIDQPPAGADEISQTSSGSTSADASATAAEIREGIETESIAGENLQQKLSELSQQQETATRIIDIQSEEGARLQTQSEDILSQSAQPGAAATTAPDAETPAAVAASSKPKTLEEIIAQQRQKQIAAQAKAVKAAQAEKGLPKVSVEETPIDFLKIVLPRSMVNSTWSALADVGESPARVLNYPILLAVIFFFVALIGFLVWRKMSSQELEAEFATVHELGEGFDEFGNPIGAQNDDIEEDEQEITALREAASDREGEPLAETVVRPPDAAEGEPGAPSLPEPVLEEPVAATPAPEPIAAAAPAAAVSSAKDTSLGDSSDTTVTEAATYISYALYDQAEELLREAIKRNPINANAYLSALMDLYYTSGNKDELVKLAETIKSDYGAGDLWEKVVTLGRAVAADESIFKDAKIEGKYSTHDFDIAAPAEADLALDSSDSEDAQTDFAFTGDDSAEGGAEIQLSDDEDFLSQFEEDFDKTMADLGMGQPDGTATSTPESKKKNIASPKKESASPVAKAPAPPPKPEPKPEPKPAPAQDSPPADLEADASGGKDLDFAKNLAASSLSEDDLLDDATMEDLLDSDEGQLDDSQDNLAELGSGAAESATAEPDLSALPQDDSSDDDSDSSASAATEADDVAANLSNQPSAPTDADAADEPELPAEEESPVERSQPVADLDLDNMSASEMEEVMDSNKMPIKGSEESMQQLMNEVSVNSSDDVAAVSTPDPVGDSLMERTSDLALDLKDILGDDGADDGADDPAAISGQLGDDQDLEGTEQEGIDEEDSANDKPPVMHEETSSFMDDILKAGNDGDSDDFSGTRTFDDDDDMGSEDDPFTKTITGSELMDEVDDLEESANLSLVMTIPDGGQSMAEEVAEDADEQDWETDTKLSTETAILSEEDNLLEAADLAGGAEEIDMGLAEQYISMGDHESARTTLLQVIENSDGKMRAKAKAMLKKLEKDS